MLLFLKREIKFYLVEMNNFKDSHQFLMNL